MIQTEGFENLAADDVDEIMAYLPDLRGKRVIDLAAGIGYDGVQDWNNTKGMQ